LAPIAIAKEKELGRDTYYNVRGNIFLGMGKYKEALYDFDTCILLNSTFPLAYVNRAIAKINVATPLQIKSILLNGNVNTISFNSYWSLPIKKNIKKTDANMESALTDCNTAIAINPQLSYAYYVRGEIKRMLQYKDYCYDFLKAKQLNYPIDALLLTECAK
jgi:tetratricopeptide (TPR) repeat protein